MNMKEVDKLAAQFAVSVSETNSLISTWMGDDISDSEDNSPKTHDQTEQKDKYGLKPLSSKAGLGSKGKVLETSLNNSNSARALQIIQKRMEQRRRAERGEESTPLPKRKPSTKHATTNDDDDEEESKSEIVSKRKAPSSFLDAYKASKKKKKNKN